MYETYIKRILDIVLSLIALILLAIPMLIISIVVKATSPGPVLFWQDRVGKHKKIFRMPKFRTMYTNAPKNTPTHLLHHAESFITPVGRVLRGSSMDEFPQLFCILKGEMSFVGPRPALWNQEDLIAERDLYGANDVLPGLTGWAQINGRDELPIPVKARYDGEYVKNITFLFDCKCFFRTFRKALSHEGVVEGDKTK